MTILLALRCLLSYQVPPFYQQRKDENVGNIETARKRNRDRSLVKALVAIKRDLLHLKKRDLNSKNNGTRKGRVAPPISSEISIISRDAEIKSLLAASYRRSSHNGPSWQFNWLCFLHMSPRVTVVTCVMSMREGGQNPLFLLEGWDRNYRQMPMGAHFLQAVDIFDCWHQNSCPNVTIQCPQGYFCADPSNFAVTAGGDSELFRDNPCPLGVACDTPRNAETCASGKWCDEYSTEGVTCDVGASCDEGAYIQVVQL
eukprot:jgi/Bigna1/90606/estExt_fgenesh1_pg.C_740054